VVVSVDHLELKPVPSVDRIELPPKNAVLPIDIAAEIGED
jgi:hypothetical protein